jgi:hypothetical protein
MSDSRRALLLPVSPVASKARLQAVISFMRATFRNLRSLRNSAIVLALMLNARGRQGPPVAAEEVHAVTSQSSFADLVTSAWTLFTTSLIPASEPKPCDSVPLMSTSNRQMSIGMNILGLGGHAAAWRAAEASARSLTDIT